MTLVEDPLAYVEGLRVVARASKVLEVGLHEPQSLGPLLRRVQADVFSDAPAWICVSTFGIFL